MLSFLKGKKNDAPAPATTWSERLRAGLERSRAHFGEKIATVFSRDRLDEATYDGLEEALLSGDCGVEATSHLLERLRQRVKIERIEAPAEARRVLAREMTELLAPLQRPLTVAATRPFVIMVAGVNGAGKTTSIGKVAHWLQSQGHSVMLAAGDTFRAAAREQLASWAVRNEVAIVGQEGGDPAAIAFDAVQAARARNVDVVIADTAGRLPTQLHLMEEIAKVKRVISKAQNGAPHEVLLVLDANIGQNALMQLNAFDQSLGLTGLVVTKLDGTAKGGVLLAIARKAQVPVRFIGVGEGLEDLRPFVAAEFVEALLN